MKNFNEYVAESLLDLDGLENNDTTKIIHGMGVMKNVYDSYINKIEKGRDVRAIGKDIFGRKLNIGDFVIYGDTTGGWGASHYISVGVIVKIDPSNATKYGYGDLIVNTTGDFENRSIIDPEYRDDIGGGKFVSSNFHQINLKNPVIKVTEAYVKKFK
jgi:hypothetical protein